MGLESPTYISDFVATNPTATDPKSQGDDHIRNMKAALLATFPNVAGAVTPTHTELNYVDGVTSAIQTQLNTKGAHAGQTWTGTHDFTGSTITVPTAAGGDADTSPASTAFVDTWFAKKASPTFTGTPLAPTASPGTNTTQIATTAYVDAAAFASALPLQTGNAGKFVTTDGSTASWASILDLKAAKAAAYTVVAGDRYAHFVLTSSDTLSLTAAATLGDGFRFWVRNDGTGVWTIDPSGAETIDGRTTIKVYPGEGFAVICDGSNWRTFGRARGPVLISTTTVGVAVASVDFETGFDDTEFTRFHLVADSISGDGAITPVVRVKKSGAYQSASYAYTDETGATATGQSGITITSVLSNATYIGSLSIHVHNAQASDGSQGIAITGGAINGAGGGLAGLQVTGAQGTAAALQGLRLLSSTNNFDAGTFRLYGFR